MIQTFTQLRNMFLQYLKEQKMEEDPIRLYQPINYIMDLGGKRIRPVALMIAYNAFSEKVDEALPLAYAFEVFHNFTLAHDDVMDDADLRRGKEAVHIKYGLNSAILSGDAMLIYAYKFMLTSTNNLELREKIEKVFTETAIEVCEGQQMDMDFENTDEVELSTYLLMIKLKTAVLVAACLKSGALLAGSSDSDAEHLYLYGLNLGLAFQIQDDILDLYSEEAGFGKKVGGDIIQKKKTFLYLKALDLADPKLKVELKELYNMDSAKDNKVDAVRIIFDKLNIKDHAIKLMNELTENAQDHLNAVSVPKERITELNELGSMLLLRKK